MGVVPAVGHFVDRERNRVHEHRAALDLAVTYDAVDGDRDVVGLAEHLPLRRVEDLLVVLEDDDYGVVLGGGAQLRILGSGGTAVRGLLAGWLESSGTSVSRTPMSA